MTQKEQRERDYQAKRLGKVPGKIEAFMEGWDACAAYYEEQDRLHNEKIRAGLLSPHIENCEFADE